MTEVSSPDDLYGLPLDRFTQARNELASRMRAAGDAAGAVEVRKLVKPNIPAWAVDQVARRSPERMKKLLELRTEIETAGDAPATRSATSARRKLMSGLVEEARAILERGGHSQTAATMQKVSQTLYGGATEEERSLLLEGRLSRELTSSDLAWSLGPDVEEVDDASSAEAGAGMRARVETLRRDQEQAEQEARRLDEEARRLEGELERLVREAEEVQTKAARVRDGADAARERAARARHELGDGAEDHARPDAGD